MTKRPEPPDPGYLLRELGYDDEQEAAASLDITPQTLVQYRKDGKGPRYVELARKIYYSKEARAEWLAAGGTRAAHDSPPVPEDPGKSFPSRVNATPSPGDDRVRATGAAPDVTRASPTRKRRG